MSNLLQIVQLASSLNNSNQLMEDEQQDLHKVQI